MPSSVLTANAIVAKERFRDDFNRVAGPTDPYAPTDWGPGWIVGHVSTGGVTWVDGSAVRLTMLKSTQANPTDPASKRVSYGFVQYDFWVPANISDTRPYFWVTQGGEYPVAIEAYQSTGSTWEVGVYHYYQSVDAYATFTPDPSTWYRVKGVFNGVRDGILAVKVWKVGDPEPSTFGAIGGIDSSQLPLDDPNDWYNLTAYFVSPTAEPGGFDNLIYGDYGAPFSPTVWGNLTAGAIKRKTMPTQYAVLDAFITARSFGAGAWIVGGRSGHSRLHDHYGTQPDTVVVLDGMIGPYPTGATVHFVLSDLLARIEALESGWHRTNFLVIYAWILPNLRASAILAKTMTYYPWYANEPLDMRVDALIVGGKTDQSISADAVIIRSPVTTFSAAAYFIDLVC